MGVFDRYLEFARGDIVVAEDQGALRAGCAQPPIAGGRLAPGAAYVAGQAVAQPQPDLPIVGHDAQIGGVDGGIIVGEIAPERLQVQVPGACQQIHIGFGLGLVGLVVEGASLVLRGQHRKRVAVVIAQAPQPIHDGQGLLVSSQAGEGVGLDLLQGDIRFVGVHHQAVDLKTVAFQLFDDFQGL